MTCGLWKESTILCTKCATCKIKAEKRIKSVFANFVTLVVVLCLANCLGRFRVPFWRAVRIKFFFFFFCSNGRGGHFDWILVFSFMENLNPFWFILITLLLESIRSIRTHKMNTFFFPNVETRISYYFVFAFQCALIYFVIFCIFMCICVGYSFPSIVHSIFASFSPFLFQNCIFIFFPCEFLFILNCSFTIIAQRQQFHFKNFCRSHSHLNSRMVWWYRRKGYS